MHTRPTPPAETPGVGRGVFYNDFDRHSAAWLRQLIADGALPHGQVEERSVTTILPGELAGFRQCHFFAGIGGWAEALRLAGWPAEREAWTASLPCQPFSCAGKQLGESDSRHLWPAFRELVRQCRPAIMFGEQVASPAGRDWLAGVRLDLESMGYVVGAADLCAASVGAPHIRQRLFWVAYLLKPGLERLPWHGRNGCQSGREHAQEAGPTAPGGRAGGVADHGGGGREVAMQHAGSRAPESEKRKADFPRSGGGVGGVGDSDGAGFEALRGESGGGEPGPGEPALASSPCGMEYTEGNGRIERGPQPGGRVPPGGCGEGFWSDFDIVQCRDGKARRIEPGSFPLAHGVRGRVGLLRGYGNAIVPQVAAEFIMATVEALRELTA